MEESDGERAAGSDTAEGTEERAIRAMPIVTTLSFVRAVKDKTRGVRVTHFKSTENLNFWSERPQNHSE